MQQNSVKVKLKFRIIFYFFIKNKKPMGNVCECQQVSTNGKAESNNLVSEEIKRHQFHKLTTSQPESQKNYALKKTNKDQQSIIDIRMTSVMRSSKPPSMVRSNLSNQFSHHLIIDPPSVYNQEKLQNLQKMSQVPSDFFNNVNMSAYFKDNKTSKSRLSKKYSFKDGPKIELQTKRSREDDFQNVNIAKKDGNESDKDNEKLMPSLLNHQNIRGSRSELKQKDSAIKTSQGIRSTAKSMIRPKIDSSLMTSALKSKKDLQTVN